MTNGRNQRQSGYHSRERQAVPDPNVSDADLQQIILRGDAVKLNEIANKLGEYYADGGDKERLSTAQVRGILDHLQRMDPGQAELQSKLQLLRPKLAYAAGRHGGKVKKLQGVTDRAILLVEADKDRFEHFRNFFEAIVAYHRYHGGK